MAERSDHAQLVAILNRWPELRGLSQIEVAIWKVLHDAAPNEVRLEDIKQAAHLTDAGVTNHTITQTLWRLRRWMAARSLQWEVQLVRRARTSTSRGSTYRMVRRENGDAADAQG